MNMWDDMTFMAWIATTDLYNATDSDPRVYLAYQGWLAAKTAPGVDSSQDDAAEKQA